jgi:cell division protein FtsB
MLGTILIALFCNAMLAAMGPRDLLLLRERRSELEATRTELSVRKAELETNVQNLRSNDRFIEHLIRKELGYARPDELVYKFPGPVSSADSATTASEVVQTQTRRSLLAGLTLQLLSEIGVTHK